MNPDVCLLVGWSVGRSVIVSLKWKKLHTSMFLSEHLLLCQSVYSTGQRHHQCFRWKLHFMLFVYFFGFFSRCSAYLWQLTLPCPFLLPVFTLSQSHLWVWVSIIGYFNIVYCFQSQLFNNCQLETFFWPRNTSWAHQRYKKVFNCSRSYRVFLNYWVVFYSEQVRTVTIFITDL